MTVEAPMAPRYTMVDRRSLLLGAGAALGGAAATGAGEQAPAATPAPAGLSPGSFEGSSSYTMSNGTLDLTFLQQGASLASVESQLDSLLGSDRPVSWVEHATVGPPFVEAGITVFDLSGSRSRSNPGPTGPSAAPRRVTPDQDFTWPLAPGADGAVVDLRQVPGALPDAELMTTLLDPSRTLVWTTVLNPKRKLIYGYLMRREDYPWIISWGSYGTPQKPVRGMEFGMSCAGRRRAATMGTLFDTPTYRWLPAKARVTTHFLMFYAYVPDGFKKVDDVRMENSQILIEDHAAGKQVRLEASMNLSLRTTSLCNQHRGNADDASQTDRPRIGRAAACAGGRRRAPA
jgi:hypothetical protein